MESDAFAMRTWLEVCCQLQFKTEHMFVGIDGKQKCANRGGVKATPKKYVTRLCKLL